jgi:hypothetical protein
MKRVADCGGVPKIVKWTRDFFDNEKDPAAKWIGKLVGIMEPGFAHVSTTKMTPSAVIPQTGSGSQLRIGEFLTWQVIGELFFEVADNFSQSQSRVALSRTVLTKHTHSILSKATILLMEDGESETPTSLEQSWSEYVVINSGPTPHEAFVDVVKETIVAHGTLAMWSSEELLTREGLSMVWSYLGGALLKFSYLALRSSEFAPFELPMFIDNSVVDNGEDPKNWIDYYLAGAMLTKLTTKFSAGESSTFWTAWLAKNRLKLEQVTREAPAYNPEPMPPRKLEGLVATVHQLEVELAAKCDSFVAGEQHLDSLTRDFDCRAEGAVGAGGTAVLGKRVHDPALRREWQEAEAEATRRSIAVDECKSSLEEAVILLRCGNATINLPPLGRVSDGLPVALTMIRRGEHGVYASKNVYHLFHYLCQCYDAILTEENIALHGDEAVLTQAKHLVEKSTFAQKLFKDTLAQETLDWWKEHQVTEKESISETLHHFHEVVAYFHTIRVHQLIRILSRKVNLVANVVPLRGKVAMATARQKAFQQKSEPPSYHSSGEDIANKRRKVSLPAVSCGAEVGVSLGDEREHGHGLGDAMSDMRINKEAAAAGIEVGERMGVELAAIVSPAVDNQIVTGLDEFEVEEYGP